MDIEARVKEAEAYYSQGLFNESLELYEALLVDATQTAPDRLSDFEARIAKLKEEIEIVDQPDAKLSAEDLSFIQRANALPWRASASSSRFSRV